MEKLEMVMKTLTVVVIATAVCVKITEGLECTDFRVGVCPRVAYRALSQSYHVVSHTRYTTQSYKGKCGWRGWRRCTKTRSLGVIVYATRYRTVVNAYCRSFCCSGYSGVGANCMPYCFPPCRNGGRCYRPGLCACPSGWTGSRCQTPVCSPSCQNGGTCTSPGRCTCTRGWTGTSCENSDCLLPCENGGTCIGGGVCDCVSGWWGATCESPICSPLCKNFGTCTSPGVCTCRIGWTGGDCGTAICSRSCENGGTCFRPDSCRCPTGWVGSRCTIATCSPPCPITQRCIRPNECA